MKLVFLSPLYVQAFGMKYCNCELAGHSLRLLRTGQQGSGTGLPVVHHVLAVKDNRDPRHCCHRGLDR